MKRHSGFDSCCLMGSERIANKCLNMAADERKHHKSQILSLPCRDYKEMKIFILFSVRGLLCSSQSTARHGGGTFHLR